MRTYLQVSWLTALLAGILAIGLLIGGQWLCFYFFRYSMPGYALRHHYLPKYLYTLLFVPLLYLLNKGLADTLQGQDKQNF